MLELKTICKECKMSDIRIVTLNNRIWYIGGKLDKAQTREKIETLEAKVAAGISTCPTKTEGESKTVDQNHFVNDINREHTEVLQVKNNQNEAIETLIYGATEKQKLLYNKSDIAYNLVKDASRVSMVLQAEMSKLQNFQKKYKQQIQVQKMTPTKSHLNKTTVHMDKQNVRC